MQETEIINLFAHHQVVRRSDVWLSIGDDAAVVCPPAEHALVMTTDTVVWGVHVPQDTPPEAVGYKSAAVNLSDLAAMGAVPAYATLAITLPEPDQAWLEAFAKGLYRLLTHHNVALIGGDTTRGPLSITLQLQGYVPCNISGMPQVLTRSGAQVGDRIYVSGTLGDAAYTLHQLQRGVLRTAVTTLDRLDYPTPRVALGCAMRSLAHAAVDISDGLLRDLGHILAQSQVGAVIWMNRLPQSTPLRALPIEQSWDWSATGGDDYELCLCIPESEALTVESVAADLECPITWIGSIESEPGLRCIEESGPLWFPKTLGYEPFEA